MKADTAKVTVKAAVKAMVKALAARFGAFALVALVFGTANFLLLLFWPTPARSVGAAGKVDSADLTRSPVFWACLFAGVVTLAMLPFVLRFVERQAGQIERQQKEIETLHALDTAIVQELDIPRLLDTAVRRLMHALDVEAAGIVLPGEAQEQILVPGRNERDRNAFAELVRGGGGSADCESIVLPLSDSGGPQGYVAVGRFRPARPFSPADHGLLAALADTIVVALTNARAFALERESARIQADLERERKVAQAMTESLLPAIPAQVGRWAFSTCYQPKSEDAPVGGDLYDLFTLENDRIGIVLADVSGKGLGAAKKLAMIKYALRAYAREHQAPSAVVQRLNDTLFDEPDMTGFVTLFYGVLNTKTSQFTFTSAGHEPPLLRHVDGSIELMNPTGMVLGVERAQKYEDHTVMLGPGEGMLLYTDGLSESRPDKESDFLGTDGITEILTGILEGERSAPQEITDDVLKAALVRSQNLLSDDVALLWLECVPE